MTNLLIVGELMSAQDMKNGIPFSDGNGRFLKAMLSKAGINPREAEYTNVFMTSAARGSVYSLCGPKEKGIPHVKYLKRGKYIRAEYEPHLRNLWKLINETKPNLILALGEAALWALTSASNLDYSRGYITEGNSAIHGRKVLPTYHPRGIQRAQGNRPYWLADLTKAAREMQFPEIHRPPHRLWIEPNLNDLERFLTRYIEPCEYLSVDIENKPGILTCIGFAPDTEHALVVPFWDSRKPGNSYWPTASEEIAAWRWVRRVLSLGKKVIGQNYLYDIQLLWRWHAIPNPDAVHDTMLLHHALQPELKKGLGMLASIYTDEVAWKGMRTETAKQGDII